jgi:hypothetical protein
MILSARCPMCGHGNQLVRQSLALNRRFILTLSLCFSCKRESVFLSDRRAGRFFRRRAGE